MPTESIHYLVTPVAASPIAFPVRIESVWVCEGQVHHRQLQAVGVQVAKVATFTHPSKSPPDPERPGWKGLREVGWVFSFEEPRHELLVWDEESRRPVPFSELKDHEGVNTRVLVLLGDDATNRDAINHAVAEAAKDIRESLKGKR
jgi:hypothetical protein